MASFNVPLPQNLKPIQHYLKTAAEHEKRDIVVAYYCLLHALQRAMEIDKKSPEARTFLVALMDHLEKIKKEHDDEAIHNEVVGQAHMENYALKVFLYADNEDRASRFNKNVVKSFYTAGMLFDVLTNFGEPAEDIEKNRKYAKWKAAYIHKCLKNGETPLPGPLGEDGEEGFDPMPQMPQPGGSSYDQPGTSYSVPPPTSFSAPGPSSGLQPPGVHAPPTTPMDSPPHYEPPSLPKPAPRSSPQPPKHDFTAVANNNWEPAPNPEKDGEVDFSAGVSLTSQHYQKAMKYCKYASSALQYEDSKTAIDNLQKALRLMTTGSDS